MKILFWFETLFYFIRFACREVQAGHRWDTFLCCCSKELYSFVSFPNCCTIPFINMFLYLLPLLSPQSQSILTSELLFSKKKNIFSIGWVTLACCLYKIWLFDRTVAPTVWVSLRKKTDFLNMSLNLICQTDFFRHWKKLNVKMTEDDSLPLKETTPLLIFPYNQTSMFLRNPFSLNTTITDRFIVYFIYWSAASKLCICTPTAPRVSLQLCFQGLSNTSRGLIPHPGDGANLSGETAD